jgi:hypothetical protein
MAARPIIVSLTAIPPRFAHLGPTLASLLAQRLAPERIIVTIPRAYRRFPDWDGRLPDLPAGVELLRCDVDLGPATKVLPVARMLRGQVVDLVFCDDDVEYPGHWLRAMRRVSDERPGTCVAAMGFDLVTLLDAPRPPERLPRARRIGPQTPADMQRQRRAMFEAGGFADIAMGHGGVMVRPDWFPDAAWDIPPVVWAVDDIWLSGWLEAQGIGIWVDPLIPIPRNLGLDDALEVAVIEGHDRNAANRAGTAWWRAHAGIWPIPAG